MDELDNRVGLGDLFYLSSPYSKYKDGHEAAYRRVAEIAGDLIRARVRVFCAVTHTHGIHYYGNFPEDYDWMAFYEIFMHRCDSLIVAQMEGWEESIGVRAEIDYFTKAGKPVYYYDPEAMELRHAPQDKVASDTL